MLTELEAKTKWCPFARIDGGNRWKQSLPADEPWALNPVPCRCIASACMAWRWEPLLTSPEWAEAVKKAAKELRDESSGRSKAVAHVNANRKAYGLPDVPFRGRCGLAGAP